MLALPEPEDDDEDVDGFEEPLSLLVPLEGVLDDESDFESDFESDDEDELLPLLVLVGPLALALEARESLMYQPLPLNTMPTG